MSALTAPRNTQQMGNTVTPQSLGVPIAANTKIYAGAQVALQAGYAVPASSATGLTVIGRCEKTIDNTGGAAGALTVPVVPGTFKWNNGAGADAIAQANVGQGAFSIDDNTVGLTDGNGTRSYAGTIVQVDSDGVWVKSHLPEPAYAPQFPQQVISIPVNLNSLAAGDMFAHTPGFHGRIKKIDFMPQTPATTASKAATITPKIGTNLVTGGALALTTANCGAAGVEVNGAAITGANEFQATDTIKLNVSAVTAFAEGSGTILLTLG